MTDHLIQARGLNSYYGASHVLRDIDFSVVGEWRKDDRALEQDLAAGKLVTWHLVDRRTVGDLQRRENDLGRRRPDVDTHRMQSAGISVQGALCAHAR